MTSTDTLRAEAEAVGRRHPHVLGGCPPHAAVIHRLASLITTEDLPPANVSVAADRSHIQVTATGCELVENTVRRWAAALELLVTETAVDDYLGHAATCWSASGWDGTGMWWLISGTEPVPTVTA